MKHLRNPTPLQPSLHLEILPGIDPTNTYIEGYPGITPFTFRIRVRITNTSPTKYTNIHSLCVKLTGHTITGNMAGAIIDKHLSKSGMLVAPPDDGHCHVIEDGIKVTGRSKVPPLAPGEVRGFLAVFEVPAPDEGGPAYVPHSMVLRKSSHYEANTRYAFEVNLLVPKQGLLGSTPSSITATTEIPLMWHDKHELETLLHVQTLDPKPGWFNNTPIHLPTSVTQLLPTPIEYSITFPNGLTFVINELLTFNLRLAIRPGNTGITLKAFILKINQTERVLANAKTKAFQTNKHQIFRHEVKISSATEYYKPVTISVPFIHAPKIESERRENSILPTRCKEGIDVNFVVRHLMKIKIVVDGGENVKLEAPCTVVPWKVKEMLGVLQDNPDFVREAIHGVAPEYVPEYGVLEE
ncbi:hypothetical protein HDV00_011837 [Rhizophlyctis rosea]|nr:hypothetical protein HDV00_011837 [Rhizophlyctis rosea]